MNDTKYLTVSALNKYIHAKFANDPYLGTVYLTGEISNYNPKSSHKYFVIKDDHATMNAVLFAHKLKNLKFEIEDGMKCLFRGQVTLYEPTGKYQIIIDDIQPDGVGALYQAYEQLKTKLTQEGLFDASHKRKLVKYPKRIAVITSPSGAVIKDIMATVKRRYGIAQLVLFPAVVQGNEAVDSIVGRLKEVNLTGGFDTIIIGRGGGSIEDLWCFNDERVVRAIYESEIPVISSVGHETDTTLADYVADMRAATPTAAAELATPVLTEEIQKIGEYQNRIYRILKDKIDAYQNILLKIKSSYVFKHPDQLYNSYIQRVDTLLIRAKNKIENQIQANNREYLELVGRLNAATPRYKISEYQGQVKIKTKQLDYAINKLYQNKKSDLLKQIDALDMLSPLKVMSRGYSFVTQKDKILKSVDDVEVKENLEIHLNDGKITATIQEIKKEN